MEDRGVWEEWDVIDEEREARNHVMVSLRVHWADTGTGLI